MVGRKGVHPDMVDTPTDIAATTTDLTPPTAVSAGMEPALDGLNHLDHGRGECETSTATIMGRDGASLADEEFSTELTQTLADTMAQRHVVVWRDRGWRVPVAPVLEFLAAAAIELILFVSIIVLGMHGGFAGHGGRRGSHAASNATAIGGVMMQSTVTSVPRVSPSWHLSRHLPKPPTLPSSLHDPVAIKFPHPDNSHNAIIGIQRHVDAWAAPTPEIAPKAVPHAVVHRHPVRSRGPQPAAVRRLQRSRYSNPNAGFGRRVSLLKGQRGGSEGAGMGRGRGLSDADGSIKVLAWGSQHIPIKYQIDPIYMRGTYRVSVSVSGRVTNVKILKSCGHPAMDQSFIDTLERTRFSPAISGGVPIVSKINITLSFGSRG